MKNGQQGEKNSMLNVNVSGLLVSQYYWEADAHPPFSRFFVKILSFLFSSSSDPSDMRVYNHGNNSSVKL